MCKIKGTNTRTTGGGEGRLPVGEGIGVRVGSGMAVCVGTAVNVCVGGRVDSRVADGVTEGRVVAVEVGVCEGAGWRVCVAEGMG